MCKLIRSWFQAKRDQAEQEEREQAERQAVIDRCNTCPLLKEHQEQAAREDRIKKPTLRIMK